MDYPIPTSEIFCYPKGPPLTLSAQLEHLSKHQLRWASEISTTLQRNSVANHQLVNCSLLGLDQRPQSVADRRDRRTSGSLCPVPGGRQQAAARAGPLHRGQRHSDRGTFSSHLQWLHGTSLRIPASRILCESVSGSSTSWTDRNRTQRAELVVDRSSDQFSCA